MQTSQCSSHSGVEILMIAITCLANLSLTRQLISTQSAFCAFLCLKSGYLVFIHLQSEIQIQLISHGSAQCESGQAIRTDNIGQEQCDDFLDHQENCKSNLVHKMCSGRICVLEKFNCICICSVNHFETRLTRVQTELKERCQSLVCDGESLGVSHPF